ncbi:MAG: helix-turn-helix transcriptional regulator [Ruminococcus sp.]|nr:helix-turn-helix transcriptional regulator [Ruminococcus sp.]
MNVGSVGYDHDHDDSFVFDKPDGPGAMLLLLVKTSALFTIGGRDHKVRPGSFVLIRYNTPCRYRSDGEGYTDDWIFIQCAPDEVRRFEELGIPIDTPVFLGNIDELSQLIHLMTYEHYSDEAHHKEAEESYLSLLLVKLSRCAASCAQPSPGSFLKRNSVLTHIRTRIYTEPDAIGSIDDLAREASLSRSGFQHAYKNMFGTSIKADMINGRMALAKQLLTSTGMTVEEISQRCGYASQFAFMRQFKASSGHTPTDYRRKKHFENYDK